MALKESDIARILHSRGIMVIMMLIMLGGAYAAFRLIPIIYIDGDRGTLLPSANTWIPDHFIDMCVNCGLTALAALAMTMLNRTFNLLRTVSQLDASLFMVMSLATPALLCQLYTGTVLVLTLLTCMFLAYSSYASPTATPRVFMIFFLLSTGSMTQYCYAVYVPVFLVSLAQMRIFNGRAVVAALAGLATPWWIALGSGLVTTDSIHLPQFTDMFATIGSEGGLHIFGVVILTMAMLIAGWALNFMKMLSYNAHMRAYTGTLSVLALVTMIAICADFSNICSYTPALYMLTAFQLSHLFANRGHRHTAAAIAAIMAIYLIIFAATISLR